MTRWALILLLAGCVHTPSHDELRATATALHFEKGYCSGNAIGPTFIQTAKHCNKGGKLLTANGKPVNVVRIIEAAQDRMILVLDRPTFKTWAKLGKPPKQGDRVRWFGNPLGEPDTYRDGYVAKITPQGVLIVATICPGDSGSGAFSDAGEIVAIVVARNTDLPCTFTLAIPPA